MYKKSLEAYWRYLVYIYIFIHGQTVLLYHYSSVWLDERDFRSWDRNLADFYASWIFYRTATRKLNVNEGILTHMYHFCFVYIYTLNSCQVLNSFEGLCIAWMATGNAFARGLNSPDRSIYIYIYKYIHVYMCVCVCVCVCTNMIKRDVHSIIICIIELIATLKVSVFTINYHRF